MRMLRHLGHRLLVGLATLALVPVSRAAEVDRFLPGDAEVVLHVNVRQILDSDLAKKYLMGQIQAQLKQNKEVQALLTAVGLDPLKDVSSITVAAPAKVGLDSGLVIVRGKFDPDKVHKAATDFADKNADSLKIHQAKHGPLYEGRNSKNGTGNPVFATFVDKGTLVLSPSRKQVLDAVTQNGGKKTAPVNKHLQTLLGKMDGKQTIWVAALASKEMKDLLAKNPQTKNLADKLQALSGGIAIGNDIKAAIRIQTSDAKAALEVRRLLEGVKAILILAATNSEEYGPLIADIVGGIKLRSDKGDVTIEAAVSAEQIEKGVKKEAKP